VLVPGSPLPLRFLPTLDESAPRTPGAVGTGNRFGRSLGALAGQSENLLTISSVYAGQGSVFVLSDGAGVPARSWVPTSPAGRFGWVVTN